MPAKLQMVLDHGKYDEVLRIADVLYGHIDILEIGYPQMVTYGLEIVSDIHKAHPDLPLCMDVTVSRPRSESFESSGRSAYRPPGRGARRMWKTTGPLGVN
jgi:hypothetical protein